MLDEPKPTPQTVDLHWIHPPETAAFLLAELGRVWPAGDHRPAAGGGWTESRVSLDPDASPSVAFALQCLPAPTVLVGGSIRELAERTGGLLADRLGESPAAWHFQQFTGGRPLEVRPGRLKLFREHLKAWFAKKRRSLARSLAGEGICGSDRPGWLVQVCWLENERLAVSVAGEGLRGQLRRVISPHPGGVFLAPIDRRPPSRAYLKLLEAEAQLGRAIGAGEACVDLGGSPGGWSWVALERGATVVGVDRAPFRADVDANPRFSFVTGDAFKYAPPGRVDWLLCDVIAAPERTIELVENWFSNRWCRNFTVTVKFRGDEDYPLLEQVKRTAGECGAEFILRRLLANKNETTLFGSLPD